MSGPTARLAVLGDPLRHTRSPDLHRAGLAALGWACRSEAIPTPASRLGERLQALAAEGYRGVNLTHPLKEAALEHVPRLSGAARRARSVNTVGFDPEGWWGETTDGEGFADWLRSSGFGIPGAAVVLLGAGGAARSVALSLAERGARLAVCGRAPERARESWAGLPAVEWVAWGSGAARARLAAADLIVHATPLSEPDAIAPLAWLPARALLVDLAYGPGPTPWVLAARAAGRHAWDGLGMLVFQARRSLSLWTGQEVPVDPLARAVGWPR